MCQGDQYMNLITVKNKSARKYHLGPRFKGDRPNDLVVNCKK